MRDTRQHHRASYDADGNIILENEWVEVSATPKEEKQEVPVAPQALREEPHAAAAPVQHAPIPEWIEELAAETREETPFAAISIRPLIGEARNRVSQAVQCFASEGAAQYRESFRNAGNAAGGIAGGAMRAWQSLRDFLLQPVWVLHPKHEPKQYNRTTLFMVDVIRFGSTFAVIFLGLFTALNYESFWQIMREKIHPLQHAQEVQEQTAVIDDRLKEKLLRLPTLATAGGEEGNLLAFLPPVGPPENRIIVPKLGLNVPLVTPSYQALLEENWEQVEKDIQEALQFGVVHYPGTARPGQAGNFFITGHSSYYPWAPGKYKTVFARLHNLDVGDEYYVYYGGDQHRYVVRSKQEVKPTEVKVLDQPINKRLSTLMTCSPVGTTLRRLILLAEEVDPLTGEALAVGEQQHRPDVQAQPAMLPI